MIKKDISGMLFRAFSEIDVFELKRICFALQNRKKIPKIDLRSVVSVYEGHTIFSIFQNEVAVYEQILK